MSDDQLPEALSIQTLLSELRGLDKAKTYESTSLSIRIVITAGNEIVGSSELGEVVKRSVQKGDASLILDSATEWATKLMQPIEGILEARPFLYRTAKMRKSEDPMMYKEVIELLIRESVPTLREESVLLPQAAAVRDLIEARPIGYEVVRKALLELLRAVDKLLPEAAKFYHELATMSVEANRWYLGLSFFEKSLGIRRQLDDLDARANSIYQIARTHHLMSNFDKARTHYRDALRLYEHTGNQAGIAACKSGLGHLMTQIGFADKAIDELKTARRIYRKQKNKQQLAIVDEVLQIAQRARQRQLA